MFHVFHVVFYIVGLRCTRHHTHTHTHLLSYARAYKRRGTRGTRMILNGLIVEQNVEQTWNKRGTDMGLTAPSSETATPDCSPSARDTSPIPKHGDSGRHDSCRPASSDPAACQCSEPEHQ